jgi:hypothetical protein
MWTMLADGLGRGRSDAHRVSRDRNLLVAVSVGVAGDNGNQRHRQRLRLKCSYSSETRSSQRRGARKNHGTQSTDPENYADEDCAVYLARTVLVLNHVGVLAFPLRQLRSCC